MSHPKMLTEQGRIIEVEGDTLWLDMVQQSTCGACAARKGCGQHLMNKLGNSSMLLKVLKTAGDTDNYKVGDYVTVAIPDDIVVKSSLIVYLLPLVLLLVFSGFAHIFLASELLTIICAFAGLVFGAVLIKLHTAKVSEDHRFQPVLVKNNMAAKVVTM